jgi:acylphosphatase
MNGPRESYLALRVTGRVQGVGFRWWAQRQARELGIRGTVRNTPDGSVEVEIAGQPQALDQLRRMLHEGPPTAHVTAVEEMEAASPPPVGLPDSFTIRH